MNLRFSLSILFLYFSYAAAGAAQPVAPAEWARLVKAAGVEGGLIVCIGCDDPQLLAALRRNDSYVVHGLDTDATAVARVRATLHDDGLYGPVSVQTWDGRNLPYVDRLVNAIVIRDAGSGMRDTRCEIREDEIRRVLAPRGVAIAPEGTTGIPSPTSRIAHPAPRAPHPVAGDFVAFTQPVPESIDEWTHYLHGADNNALAEDTLVGPPRHIQWRSEPRWGRDHHTEKGTQPTVRTVVSSRGRLFCLIDETKSSDMKLPGTWTLVARDAFSGVRLWKRRLAVTDYPKRLEQVWRQLIADGDRLYAVLGDGQPLSQLSAVNGEVLQNYPGSEGLSEVIKDGDTLFVLCADDRLTAYHAETADTLWTWHPVPDETVVRGTPAASAGKVFVKTDKALCCLSADTGKMVWRVPLPGPEKKARLNFPHEKLLVGEGVVLCSYGGKDPTSLKRDVFEYLGSHPRVHEYGGRLGAFSADDGRQLWETAYLPNLESAPGEIYVHDGLVWLGPDFAQPRDLRTGEVRKTNPVIERLWTDGHHYRCYPGKATSRYVITAKRGIELIDMTGEDHSRNNWVRATCRVGFTPCNGLLYAPPHSCGCYMEAKLFGFWALAGDDARSDAGPELSFAPRKHTPSRSEERLSNGPAANQLPTSDFRTPTSNDWWTYRGGSARGGATVSRVSADLEPAWTTQLGGRLSAATAADSRVYVAQVDAHTVHALDAQSGRKLWSFIAGGRVDSPPTLVAGLVLFGSADGNVYCLRAADGALAWRFRAAPRHINAVAFDQPESVWPVHGSVLIHEGVIYAAAGRSSYLDGGISLVGLNPATGEVVAERRIASQHAGITEPPGDAAKYAVKNRQNWSDYKTKLAPDRADSFAMRGATTDVLVADHDSLYLRHLRFDRQLAELPTGRAHLFSTSALLDNWEHNRSYWVLGTGNFYDIPVAYPWILRRDIQVPVGLMLAFDEQTVWGIHRGKGYTLYAMPRPDPEMKENTFPDFQARSTTKATNAALWTAPLSIRPRALLKAGDLLFVGGMSAERSGGRLQIVSATDGKTVGEVEIASPPVWDGLAAAGGRLIIPATDGSLMCLAPR